jgi:hypothetical protein
VTDEYDELDRLLGVAMTQWLARRGEQFDNASLEGPLEAPGMDPTWILELRQGSAEANVFLFRGPYAEVGWSLQGEYIIQGHEGLTRDEMTALLDRLGAIVHNSGDKGAR